MTGFFSRMFDPPRRPGFFGGDLGLGSGTSQDANADDASLVDGTTNPPQWRRSFFALDLNDLLFPPSGQSVMFGTLAPSFGGASLAQGGSTVVPVVADFGPRGDAGEQANKPYWRNIPGHPSTDPRMPFFVLPPNTLFNMPIITDPRQLPGTPYVDDDGNTQLYRGWNPWEGRPIGPGRGI